MIRALTDRCDNCKFSRTKTVAWDECRRFPPVRHGQWSEVPADGWCGEFQAREPKA